MRTLIILSFFLFSFIGLAEDRSPAIDLDTIEQLSLERFETPIIEQEGLEFIGEGYYLTNEEIEGIDFWYLD